MGNKILILMVISVVLTAKSAVAMDKSTEGKDEAFPVFTPRKMIQKHRKSSPREIAPSFSKERTVHSSGPDSPGLVGSVPRKGTLLFLNESPEVFHRKSREASSQSDFKRFPMNDSPIPFRRNSSGLPPQKSTERPSRNIIGSAPKPTSPALMRKNPGFSPREAGSSLSKSSGSSPSKSSGSSPSKSSEELLFPLEELVEGVTVRRKPSKTLPITSKTKSSPRTQRTHSISSSPRGKKRSPRENEDVLFSENRVQEISLEEADGMHEQILKNIESSSLEDPKSSVCMGFSSKEESKKSSGDMLPFHHQGEEFSKSQENFVERDISPLRFQRDEFPEGRYLGYDNPSAREGAIPPKRERGRFEIK